MKAEDGKLYAVVTLRDVIERNDVGDLPFLSEIKRLYDENDRLRELVRDLVALPAVPAFDCFGCRYEKHTDCAGGCALVRRAEELGIEVKE